MARHLSRLGRGTAALTVAKAAVGENPLPAEAAFIGCLLRDSGDLAQALHHLRTAMNPASADFLAVYGDCLLQSGAITEASKAYEAALLVSPDHAPARAGHGVALSASGNHTAAVEQLNRARALNPHDEWIHVALARALARAGRTEEALRQYGHLHGRRIRER